jgi:hypothetical protein
MKRSPMAARNGRVNPRNHERSAAALDEDFGEEARTVRLMPCLVAGCAVQPCQPAHVKSRGAGGGRFDIVPLCHVHHREQHDRGIKTFAAKYSLDLRAEADRIAVMHSDPIGLREVARRWADAPDGVSGPAGYDLDALLGWCRREMDRSAAGKAASELGLSQHLVRGAILLDLCVLPLSINELGAIAEAAGWPS